MGALERPGYMVPQHITLIDTVLTMPGKTIEEEHRRRVAAINAVIVFCDIEEGAPSRIRVSNRPVGDAIDDTQPISSAKRLRPCPIDESTEAFHRAIASVCINIPIKDQRFALFALVILNYLNTARSAHGTVSCLSPSALRPI
ncbi:hypothetical protein PENARI_c043G01074 [Penicillium arizonense]|uniref:Uncharacterized protein n=1 Tax=Penicillium arizonense TaxID=1835702 RepID=A0A1F5L2P3_PENAI|nr:hypothetical protein PENARI_c043G01074 [Penicillium arizonense]OGE47474.1 hypothetical protein PENARI_c043G01074 [Penicillium arizonense]